MPAVKRAPALVITMALLAPSSALAQGSSTCQSYNPQLCGVSSTAAGPSAGGTSSSSLPFTGLDVVLLAVGGGTLVGGGLVVRRLARVDHVGQTETRQSGYPRGHGDHPST
jgi:uncharacterized membrane protein